MDKKPLAALILAKISKSKSDESNEPDESESVDGLDSAISDMFDAQKAGDKSAFKEAFKAAVSMCDDDSYGEEEK